MKLGRIDAADRQVPADPREAVGLLLRYGVLLSAFLILAGLVMLLFQVGPKAFVNMPQIQSPEASTDLTSVRAVLSELLPPEPEAVIVTGLIILIGTPVVAIAVSAIWFVRERDWLYVAITTFVFAMLMLGFAIGRGEGPAGK